MQDITYQGYANQATWAMSLTINNERSHYHHWKEQVEKHDLDVDQLAEKFRLFYSDHWQELAKEQAEWADLTRNPNWFELAREFLHE